jgi:hypothetical protein
MARRSAATTGRLAGVAKAEVEAEAVAVAMMEPHASRVTETLPDAVWIDAVASPSLLMVAMAVGVLAAREAAAEAALLLSELCCC